TLTLSVDADLIHAVVPITGAHERQSMGTQPIAMLQRTNAVFINSALLLTHRGQVEIFLLLFGKDWRRDERYDLIQHVAVARCHNIVMNHERQEIEVVGDSR